MTGKLLLNMSSSCTSTETLQAGTASPHFLHASFPGSATTLAKLFFPLNHRVKQHVGLQVYKGEAYPWIAAALAAIPSQAATDADKQSFLKSAQDLASGIDNRW